MADQTRPIQHPLGVIPRALFAEARARELLRAMNDYLLLLVRTPENKDLIIGFLDLWVAEFRDRVREMLDNPLPLPTKQKDSPDGAWYAEADNKKPSPA